MVQGLANLFEEGTYEHMASDNLDDDEGNEHKE